MGYDKSTAITLGLEEELVPAAWVTLVGVDSDLWGFVSYLVVAIHSLSSKARRQTVVWTDALETPSMATPSGSLGEDTQ